MTLSAETLAIIESAVTDGALEVVNKKLNLNFEIPPKDWPEADKARYRLVFDVEAAVLRRLRRYVKTRPKRH